MAKVIDLTPDREELYFDCLEDWSDEIKEAGEHKACWYRRMLERGLRVKLALDDRGEVGGMIQYLPIAHAPVEGNDLYFVHCIWVHGHKQGRGDCRDRGLGKALLAAAEEDARALGAKGLAAWGLILPFFMRAAWFRKQGYRPVDRLGIALLLWKPFAAIAEPPSWIRPCKKPGTRPGKVVVTAFINGWCTAQNMTFERAKRAAASFGEAVEFQAVDTSAREVFLEWGISDGLFIDSRAVRTGPPPSYEKIRAAIEKRVRKLRANS